MMLDTLGWALVHSVWQAAALAALLALVLAASRRARPAARYGISVAALAGTVLLPLATVLWLAPAAGDESAADGVRRIGTGQGPMVTGPSAEPTAEPGLGIGAPPPSATDTFLPPIGALVRARVEAALPGIVMLWAAGLLLSVARLGGGLVTLRRLVRDEAAPPSATLESLTQRLVARMRIRTLVRVRESARVHVPLVIGWSRPLILVPAALVTGLAPAELEALVAHELAHIRRYDILANLVQRAIETLFFFHPAVWWISARVREERENCCDDLAVGTCDGDAATYASALLALEELRGPGFATVLAASGGPLVRRVQRLVDGRAGRVELGVPWLIGTLGLLALLAGSDSTIMEHGRRTGSVVSRPSTGADSGAAPASVRDRPPSGMGWQVVEGATLRARWLRASSAGVRDRAAYWIGYAVAAPEDGRYRYHFDDSVAILVGDERERGRVMWRPHDAVEVRVPGEPLPQVVGQRDGPAIVVFAGFEPAADGSPRLTRMHAASAELPASLGARRVYWLGGARDAESIGLLRELFGHASKGRQRDLVAIVGIHDDARLVVEALAAWLMDPHQRESVREEAARSLALRPTGEALATLAIAARSVDDRDVMAEAVEALSELAVDAATDTLLAIARGPGSDARREAAIEGLGNRGARAVPHLLAMTTEPGDEDLQEEAVAALARAATDSTLHLVAEVALSHARAPVRERAARAYARAASPTNAMATLRAILATDPDRDVRLDAVRSMRRIRSVPLAVESLSALARGHVNSSVRKAAVRALGDLRRHPPALSVLRELADSDHADVRARAREVLDR